MKTKLITIVLLVLIMVGVVYYIKHQGSLNYKTYTNSTIGISFKYPVDWELREWSDPITRGDEIKDGEIYNGFGAQLSPPKSYSAEPNYIAFSHFPFDYDNKSIEEQFKAESISRNCTRKKNNNGVEYCSYEFYCQEMGGCGISVIIPTGKYPMSFGVVDGNGHSLRPDSTEIAVFEKIIDSVELR